MIIAFIGNNGTGKTTITKEMEKRLRVIGIDATYKKEFDHFLLQYVHKIYSPYKGKNYNPFSGTIHDAEETRQLSTTGKEGEEENGRGNGIIFKLWTSIRPTVWPVLVWVDCLSEWIFYKITMRNKVILLDRYAYDHFISWEGHGWANKLLRVLYMHFPKPDLAFVLDASPSVCLDRVGARPEERYPPSEEDKEEKMLSLGYQRNRYQKLADELDLKLVNTEKYGLDDSLKEVFSDLRKYHFEKDKIIDEDKVLTLVSYPHFNPHVVENLGFEFKWQALDWDYIMDLAVKNNVELLLCNNLMTYYKNELPENVITKLERIREICRNKQEKMSESLKLVHSAFEEKSIEYVIFKSLPPFEFTPVDADTLVKGKDFKEASKILKEMEVTTDIVDLYYTDPESEVLTKPSWNGHTIEEGPILRRRRKRKVKLGDNEVEVFVPSPEDEIVILSAHSLFQHQYSTLGELLYVMELIRNNNIDFGYIDSQTKDWNESFEFLLSTLVQRYFLFYNDFLAVNGMKCVNVNLKPVRIHPLRYGNSVRDIIDNVLVRIRYTRRRELPYNSNWINKNLEKE